MHSKDAPSLALSIGGQPMVLRRLTGDDMPDVLALHQRVFGGPVDLPWYEWKYQRGAGEAMGVWCDGALIAHCAGFPRLFGFRGVSATYLQIGDVMVAPEWRGVLTRHGPFFHVSQGLYGSRLGCAGPYPVGFGFPNARHMRLAVKSGLSWDCAAMHELEWSGRCSRQISDSLWRLHPLLPSDEQFDASVETAWLRMSKDAHAVRLGDRSASHVRWRYASRPGPEHRFFRLCRPWSEQTLGLVVLGPVTRDQPVHWLDWIGPIGMLGMVSRLCHQEATRLGASSLLTWASSAVVMALQSSGFSRQTEVARIGVPVASAISSEEVAQMSWWFMSGDTDFL